MDEKSMAMEDETQNVSTPSGENEPGGDAPADNPSGGEETPSGGDEGQAPAEGDSGGNAGEQSGEGTQPAE